MFMHDTECPYWDQVQVSLNKKQNETKQSTTRVLVTQLRSFMTPNILAEIRCRYVPFSLVQLLI